MRRTALLSLALLAVGCRGNATGPDEESEGHLPAAPGLATGSPVADMPVPEQADPGALDELLAAAPRSHPQSTGPDGGTLVATETGAAPDAGAPQPAAPAPMARVAMHVGEPEIQPGLSSPAMERTARELIYWKLAQSCPGPNGEALPADVITLVFTIRSDGSVDPASVSAEATDERYEDVAHCVLREFSAMPFKGPPATVQNSARVLITWPSVD